MSGVPVNPKNAAWYAGGGLAAVLPVGCGKVFYVNGGSDGPVVDTNDGLTPATPKRLLQSAINLCTSNNNDVVIVLNYGGNARAAETFPINVNKDMVHIIGVSTPASKWPVVSVLAPAGADTAKPALNVTGQRVEICGLELGGGDTAGCVHVGSLGGVWAAYIHDCYFGVTGDSVGQDGVRVPVTFDAPYLLVEGCQFGAYVTRDGVRVDGNATRGMVGNPTGRGNLFKALAGIAINMSGSVASPGIYNNVLALPSNTAGKGITLSATVSGAIVDNNRSNFGDTEMANNPFADGAGAGVNTWLYNVKGITATMPA
jgi:hypothetical protein